MFTLPLLSQQELEFMCAKIFKDELKTSPNNNCMGLKAVFKISAGERGGKAVTMPFGDVIIRVITSAPKKIYKQVTYR